MSASADSHLSNSVPSLKAFTLSTARVLRGLVAVWCLLAALPAWAQRVQFPTMVDESAVSSPPMSPISPNPALTQPPALGPGPVGAPTGAPAFDPYSAPLSQPPAPYSPYTPSPYTPPPYSPTPGALYPDGVQLPQLPPGPSFGQPLRFLQEVRGRWTWLSPMGTNSLGVNDVETSASFAFPFFKTTSPLVVTPGFGIHFWQGPVTQAPDFADLPPETYDAYLDGCWYPHITPWLSAQVGARVGAYTDFNTFTTHSIRVMGRGLGVITFTPTLQFAVGVVYIDRVQIKLLPAGGIVWTPNPDARYEILFPNPKLARRFTTLGNTDLWLYATGEYGGGSWTFQRIGGNDQGDYNDIRVAGGIESYGYRGAHAFFEVGYVFNRQIIYRSGSPNFNPSDTIMLRAGLEY